jgi:hypothetical protein
MLWVDLGRARLWAQLDESSAGIEVIVMLTSVQASIPEKRSKTLDDGDCKLKRLKEDVPGVEVESCENEVVDR